MTKKELVKKLANDFKFLKSKKIISVSITQSILNKQTLEELQAINKEIEELYEKRNLKG